MKKYLIVTFLCLLIFIFGATMAVSKLEIAALVAWFCGIGCLLGIDLRKKLSEKK